MSARALSTKPTEADHDCVQVENNGRTTLGFVRPVVVTLTLTGLTATSYNKEAGTVLAKQQRTEHKGCYPLQHSTVVLYTSTLRSDPCTWWDGLTEAVRWSRAR